ncbi:hypothetical protein K443DRAFT_12474 [Laccaria amethystina LaAM-08-1]|uniref:Lysine-specific metallo-endopeptidase domain-containing protein n=1 Tax=Laccaria amethystina LaAM-08-1 TaxID=1095629 RepID=A0A0C9WRH5_9AGAR|nr:hypothetical protein K443DRAFT_12474 [Laccaria amethystina LaAM-08-1]
MIFGKPTTLLALFCLEYEFNAPNTGTDSKAGTLVHETSHFTANGDTNNYAYGQSVNHSKIISRTLAVHRRIDEPVKRAPSPYRLGLSQLS